VGHYSSAHPNVTCRCLRPGASSADSLGWHGALSANFHAEM
jgi:hypothetical protein